MQLSGLHHVTAITARAEQNLDFYTQVLGLRLVKKTVNQDDVSAYHLFYADKFGSPGTDLTFFDWPNTPPNQNGAGSIARVMLRAPGPDALRFWEERLTRAGVPHSGLLTGSGPARLRFSDPEGLELELVDDGGAPGGTPWEGSPVPPEVGLTGLHAVHLMVRDLDRTARVRTDVLGFQLEREVSEPGDPARTITVFTTAGGGPGTEVHVEASPDLPISRLGHGGVHHVAFRTPDAGEQLEWRDRIAASGLRVTDVIDRFYFKSIYFRIPGGMLFEIATDGPGFAADEDPERLGEKLALPPFLEPHRDTIEAGLRPL